MTEQDKVYFQRRAEEELQLAQRATVPEANVAHNRLAEAYLDRLSIPEQLIPAAEQSGPSGYLFN